MEITSKDFENNQSIPSEFTCDGQDVNPSLQIIQPPQGVKSFVLIVDDPDAPAGTWVHWTVWNIKPDTQTIEKDSVPKEAAEGKTSFGHPGYGGPCPPSGVHRYFFKLYALDVMLDIAPGADIEQLYTAMEAHVIQEAQLVGTYSRQ